MQFMVLLHFQVGPSLYITPKHALQELEGTQRLLSIFEGKHLEHEQTKPANAYLPQWQARMILHG